jgi:hypothetical protein
MPAGLVAATVVNSALEQIASQVRIGALTDATDAAQAANVIYAPTVQLMLREIEPDFARFTAALAVAITPPSYPPWAFEYIYPADCVRLRQVRPPAGGLGSLVDPNDPQPIRANVAFDVIAAVNTKVILTNQADALAVYTSLTVTEAQWDSVFTDAVVRRLANPLAMALSGRPDFAKTILEQSAMMAVTAEAIEDSGFRRRAG